MSAADNLINEIAKEMMSLEEGPYGEVMLTDPCREPLPPPDAFLAPEPDVLVPPIDPDSRAHRRGAPPERRLHADAKPRADHPQPAEPPAPLTGR